MALLLEGRKMEEGLLDTPGTAQLINRIGKGGIPTVSGEAQVGD